MDFNLGGRRESNMHGEKEKGLINNTKYVWKAIRKYIIIFYLMPVTMTKVSNTCNNSCWQGYAGRGTLIQCQWKYKLVQQLWKS